MENKNLLDLARRLFDQEYQKARKVVPFTDLIQINGGGTPKTGVKDYWGGRGDIDAIRNYSVPWPDHEMRTFIGEVYSTIDKKLDANKLINKNLAEFNFTGEKLREQ